MRALLDVSMLLPLFDFGHVLHQRASTWYAENREAGWASCPLTQNGFARIVCQSAYPRPARIIDALAVLQRQLSEPDHEFWPDDISIADDSVLNRERILGSSQITDIYLLALAVKNGGRLVTFDRGVSLAAVREAKERHLVVL